MQSPALLLVAVAAAAALKCQTTERAGASFEAMAAAPPVSVSDMAIAQCTGGGWQACAHFISKQSRQWVERRSGCWPGARDEAQDLRAALVRKYCADASDQCVHTLSYDKALDLHYPTYLCCCYTDDCGTTVVDYARQQLQAAPARPEWKTTGNMCWSQLAEASTLRQVGKAAWQRIEPGRQVKDNCSKYQEQGPCADFIYRKHSNGDYPWQHWLAGCRYKYKQRDYADIVEQYCSAATVSQCFTFDMVEPESREAGAPYYTTAYMCCCEEHTAPRGYTVICVDTVQFALDEIAKSQRATPANSGSSAAATSSTSALTTAASSSVALSNAAAATTAPPTGAGVVVVAVVVGLSIIVALIVVAVVLLALVCRKEKTLECGGADATTAATSTTADASVASPAEAKPLPPARRSWESMPTDSKPFHTGFDASPDG